MKGKRVLAGCLTGLMLVMPVQVRAEEVKASSFNFVDMNDLKVTIPADLPLEYKAGSFKGSGTLSVKGSSTAYADYDVSIAVGTTNIEYVNETDSNSKANGVVTFGTDGTETWTVDEVNAGTNKSISIDVADFPEVEGTYSSKITYSIKVNESLHEDIYFTKIVDDSKKTCTITGLTEAGKEWVKSAVTSDSSVSDTMVTNKAAGELVIPETLAVGGKAYKIVAIGDSAFKGNTDIFSVSMAETVTKLGKDVFRGCNKMVSCQLSDNITDWGEAASGGGIFYECSKLSTVNIPNGVSNISYSNFYGCTALTSVEIPNNVKELGDYAYGNCSGLVTVVLPADIKFYSVDTNSTSGGAGNQFRNCTKLANINLEDTSITSIAYGSFYGTSALKNITIPDTVTVVEFGAFWNSGLTSVYIPDNCTLLQKRAFSITKSLTEVSMPIDCEMPNDSSECAFLDSPKLTKVTYRAGKTGVAVNNHRFGAHWGTHKPYSSTDASFNYVGICDVVFEEGVKTIGTSFCQYSYGVKSVTIPSSVTDIAATAFAQSGRVKDVYWSANNANVIYSAFKECGKDVDTTLHLGDNITEINQALTGSYATENQLWGDSNVKYFNYVHWGKSNVTELKELQFYYCRLKEIDFPESVKTIGQSAFLYCDAMTTATVPSTIESVGLKAFMDCHVLKDVYWDCYKITDLKGINGGQVFFVGYGTNESDTTLHFGDSFQENGVSAVPLKLFGENQLSSLNLYDNRIRYVDWGTFKPTTFGDAFIRSGLTEVTIPSSVTRLPANAFNKSSNLKIVYIEKELDSIGDYAFAGTAVDIVYYAGAESYKDTNLLISATGNSQLTDTTWIYAEGDETNTYKNYNWTYDTVNNTAVCNGLNSHGSTIITDTVEILSSFSKNGVTYIVVGIGDNAFKDNTIMTSITLPDTLVTIGANAFSGCTGLTSLVIPEGVTTLGYSACYGCKNLVTVSLPSTLTDVGNAVDVNSGTQFWNCTALTTINIPSSLNVIPRAMFGYCTSLKNIDIPSSVTEIGFQAFTYSGLTGISIPENCTIQSKAFSYCQKLLTVDIPDSVILSGNTEESNDNGRQFERCNALTSFTFPSATTEIPGNALMYCSAVKKVVIPEGVITIGKAAISNCGALTEIDLPSTLTTVLNNAFTSANKLTTVNYNGTEAEKGRISIGNSGNTKLTGATWNCLVATALEFDFTEELELLEEDGIEVITADMLYHYPKLKVLNIAKTVKSIEINAFIENNLLETVRYNGTELEWKDIKITEEGNENLLNAELIYLMEMPTVSGNTIVPESEVIEDTEYSISNGVPVITTDMFKGYELLKGLTISSSVISIEADAFTDCISLKDVIYEGTEEEWSSIEIDSGNENLLNADFTFTKEEEPKEEPVEEPTEEQIPEIEEEAVPIKDETGNSLEMSSDDFEAEIKEEETGEVTYSAEEEADSVEETSETSACKESDAELSEEGSIKKKN